MERWIGKTAIVTGASSGIGESIAIKLVEEGLNVVGLARRKVNIDELSKSLLNRKGKLYSFHADITKEEDILRAFKWTEENVGPVHVLINNAGVYVLSLLAERSLDDWNMMIQTNFIGLAIATREAIRAMNANKVNGHIININSVGGKRVSDNPLGNLSTSSKHAVGAFTEALRIELGNAESKIKITSINPGLTDTSILGVYKYSPSFAELERKCSILKAEDVAKAVVYALSTPPHVQITDLTIRPVGELNWSFKSHI